MDGLNMWIEYNSGKDTLQWENSETKEIIQSYGADYRYPAFKDKIDSGEIIPVKWEDTDEAKAANMKRESDIKALQVAEEK